MYSKLKRESNEKRSRHTSLEWPRGIHLQLQDAIRGEQPLTWLRKFAMLRTSLIIW